VFGLSSATPAQDGILVLNVESPGWDSELVRARCDAMSAFHPRPRGRRQALNKLGNVLIVASNRPLELPPDRLGNPGEFLHDDYEHFLNVQMNHAWDNRFEPAPGGRVLTDDRNPVDIWSERINLAARQELHAMWKKPGTSW
jgi:hypothetical protein